MQKQAASLQISISTSQLAANECDSIDVDAIGYQHLTFRDIQPFITDPFNLILRAGEDFLQPKRY